MPPPQSQDFSNARDLPKLGPANLGEQERTLMKKNLSTTTTLTGGTYNVAAFASFTKATTSKAKKATLFLFSVAVLLAGSAAAVCGSSALDGFDPSANFQLHVVGQPDGEILFGGDFTTLLSYGGVAVPPNHIAWVDPAGPLDITFNLNANLSGISGERLGQFPSA